MRLSRLTGSSFSIYKLKIGEFGLLHLDRAADSFVIGHYPLALYSHKVNVIPEALDAGFLPPLVLQKSGPGAPYIQLMGSSPNLDSSEYNFELGNTDVLLDSPDSHYSFALYFDLVSRRSQDGRLPDVRFNLFKFTLLCKDAAGSESRLLFVSFDVIFSEIQEYIEFDSSEVYYTGNLYIDLFYFVAGDTSKQTRKTGPFPVTRSRTKQGDEVATVPGRMYKSAQTEQFRLEQLLSPQLFLMTVGPEASANWQVSLCSLILHHRLQVLHRRPQQKRFHCSQLRVELDFHCGESVLQPAVAQRFSIFKLQQSEWISGLFPGNATARFDGFQGKRLGAIQAQRFERAHRRGNAIVFWPKSALE